MILRGIEATRYFAKPDDAAADADHAGFHQMLHEQLATAGPERATQAHRRKPRRATNSGPKSMPT